jgi:hypothetical protein
MNLSLTFLGGAGTVTGSKHLLSVGQKKILFDCGLFQGVKDRRLLNWKARSGSRENCGDIISFRACRSTRDPRLDRRIFESTETNLHRSRRTPCGGRAAGADHRSF